METRTDARKLALTSDEKQLLIQAAVKAYSSGISSLATDLRNWMYKQQRVVHGIKPNPGQVQRSLVDLFDRNTEAQTLCIQALQEQSDEIFHLCAKQLNLSIKTDVQPVIVNAARLEAWIASILQADQSVCNATLVRLVFRILGVTVAESVESNDASGSQPSLYDLSENNPVIAMNAPTGWEAIWSHILLLPVDAPAWENLQEFIAELRILAQRRLQELDARHHLEKFDAWLRMQSDLLRSGAENLELKVDLFQSWPTEAFIHSQLDQVQEHLQHLLSELELLKQLKSRSTHCWQRIYGSASWHPPITLYKH